VPCSVPSSEERRSQNWSLTGVLLELQVTCVKDKDVAKILYVANKAPYSEMSLSHVNRKR
jgi:hypothetical protein